jgi:hypothetical protein
MEQAAARGWWERLLFLRNQAQARFPNFHYQFYHFKLGFLSGVTFGSC